MSKKRDVILLIHGTGSGSSEDEGNLWWQAKSPFCKIIDEQVTPHARCHKKKEVFRWSGKNSEQERRRAGKLLYNHLLQFENKKRPYHLIAHSHGGIVIWNALCQAAKSGNELQYLKSWSSMGTPFLQYRAQFFNLWLILPFLLSLLAMLAVVNNYLWLFVPGIRLNWAQIDKTTAPLMLTLFSVLFFVCAYSLFWIIATIRSIVYLYYWRKHSKQAAAIYSHYWMDLYSGHDEAINALGSTLNPSGRIIPRWQSDFYTLKPIAFIYNTIAFFIDEFTWSKIKKGLQGTDILGLYLDKVSWPYHGSCKIVELPEETNQRLIQWANENIKKIIEPIRKRAGKFELNKAINTITSSLEGKELIHSSYYQLEEIIRMAGNHVKDNLEPKDTRQAFAFTVNLLPDKTKHRAKVDNFIFQIISLFLLLFITVWMWGSSKMLYTVQLRLGTFRGDYLQKVNFQYTDLRGAKLNHTDLSEANMFSASLENADFYEADMWEVNLRQANMSYANLALTNLDGADLSQAVLLEADLSSANVREAILERSILCKACLNFANLQSSDLSKADLQGAYLWSTNLQETNLQDAILRETKFFYADLRGANLANADLTQANLTGADLSGANLTGANLTGANLSKAKLNNANLQDATLQQIQGYTLQQIRTAINYQSIRGVTEDFFKE